MELETPRVWLRISVELLVDGTLVIGARDDTGRSVRPPRRPFDGFGWNVSPFDSLFAPPTASVQVRWPTVLVEMLTGAIQRASSRPRTDGLNPVVPAFVTAAPELALFAVEIVEGVLHNAAPSEQNRWIVISEQHTRTSVLPFSLPLNVLGVAERGAEILQQLTSPWRSPIPALQPHLADFAWVDAPEDVSTWLREREVDLLILDGNAARALSTARRRSRPPAVRAAIVLGVGNGTAWDGAAVSVPLAARNLLTVRGPADGAQLQAVKAFLDALSHDHAIHDAVAQMRRTEPRHVSLAASPDSVHDLRLTSAWALLEGDVAELSGAVGAEGPQDLESVPSGAVPSGLETTARDLVAGLNAARSMQLNFARETHGLVPLAEAHRHLASAREAEQLLRSQPAAQIGRDDRLPRVVNLGLRRQGGLVASPGTGSTYVDAQRSLAAGARYLLDAQIGIPWPRNLVVDNPKKAALSLPDDRSGNLVEIVVFSEDVAVEGPRSIELHVPRSGPSKLASFSILAPTQTGPTWIRISVFHQGNLLQTLKLDVIVTDVEEMRPSPVLVARLEHSATRDWGNLAVLGPRALSMTLNADGSGGHHLFVKARNVSAAVPVQQASSLAAVQNVRRILTDAVDGRVDPAETIWLLAEQGEQLRYWVINRLTAAEADAMRGIARSNDETLQIVRADSDQAFPWSLLYDWSLPRHLVGDPLPPVCFGTTDDGNLCEHRAGAANGVCVRGFWGIRHRVEELLADPDRSDLTLRVDLGDPSVLIALGVEDDATATLATDLPKIVAPSAVRRLGPTDHLLESLFQPNRPGVVLILGHNKSELTIGEPDGVRINVLTADGWFRGVDVARLWDQRGRWEAPRSLVLLLSCGSAASQPTELTSYLSSLQRAGAGAVIGTQCDVFTPLAVEFAVNVLGAMTSPGGNQPTLADATRLTRRRIVMDRKDPCGFIFDAYGPADLTLGLA